MTLDEINIGDKVLYIAPHLSILDISVMNDYKERNSGIVTSKNFRFVFVRYNTLEHSQATDAKNLQLITE